MAMNDAAPITWLVGKIDDIVSAGAGTVAGNISGVVAPLASACFGIYMLLILVNYLRGAETEPVMDFFIRMGSWAVVIGLGLNATNYTNTVIPIVTGLGSDLANAVSGGTATAGALDQLALHYFNILETGYENANRFPFPASAGPLILYFIKAACILIGLIPFLVAATITVIIADVGSVMVAMVGPLYFAAALFPATRQYFSAWVNTALSYALIPLFVAVISLISVNLSKEMLSTVPGGSLDDVTLKGVFLASMGNLILLFLLKQVSSLASSLSAGGINAGMAGGVGAAASAVGGFVSGRGGRQLAAAGRGAGRGAAWVYERMRRGNSIKKAG